MVVLHPPNVAEVETMMVMGLEIGGPYSIKDYVDSYVDTGSIFRT